MSVAITHMIELTGHRLAVADERERKAAAHVPLVLRRADREGRVFVDGEQQADDWMLIEHLFAEMPMGQAGRFTITVEFEREGVSDR